MTEFDQIYQEYFNSVFLYVRQLSNGNEDLAEEITSETFFKAMRSIDYFRGDCDIRVWLCQIAKNCYYTYIKNTKKAERLSDDDVAEYPESAMTLEEMLLRHEEATTIRELLHTLEEPYKEVFMWRVFGELSFKQIGALFRKSDNWACVTYHRAKSMLLKRLEDFQNEK